ncbi:hypothetical protein B0H13DRAFT_1917160 [Mycena leptocephala]|nr:hypothetical protein B0H13DRAFT_1917160 [Mycena leptocephala]
MTLSIALVPEDILLEFAKQLDVADFLSFLSVCRTIRALRFQRALWLDALIRIREVQMQPLPLLTAEALDALSLLELQNLVQQAHRLMENLQSANLVVSYIWGGGVSCWDILTSHRVAHLEIPDVQIHTEVCVEIMGKALIGTTRGNFKNFGVICIDFHDRAHIAISHVISPPTNNTDDPFGRRSFFINAQVIGSCTTSDIVFWSLDSNVTARIEPPHVANSVSPSAFKIHVCCEIIHMSALWMDSICITLAALASQTTIQMIPLPSASDHHPTGSDARPTTLTIPYPIGSSPRELRARHGTTGFGGTLYVPRVFVPHYGIFAVTGRSFTFGQSLTPTMHLIHFWPGRAVHANIEFGQVHLYEHVHHIHQMVVSASGTYVLLLATDVERYLGLVHFSAAPEPHTTFRKLDIGNVFLESCTQIALDDSLGLVFVVDGAGVATVISYV